MQTIQIKDKLFNQYITEAQIQTRIKEIVAELSEKYKDSAELKAAGDKIMTIGK